MIQELKFENTILGAALRLWEVGHFPEDVAYLVEWSLFPSCILMFTSLTWSLSSGCIVFEALLLAGKSGDEKQFCFPTQLVLDFLCVL